MKTFGDFQSKAGQLFNELVELSANVAGCEYTGIKQKVFDGQKWRLFIEHHPDLPVKPEWVGNLVELTSGVFNPGEIKPATKDMMAFKRMPGAQTVTFLGHGYFPDVVSVLQGMVDFHKQVVEPAKVIISKVCDNFDPNKAGILIEYVFDVRDIMCKVTRYHDGHYELSVYMGTISVPFVAINIGFDKDLLLLMPVRIRGNEDKVKRTMDEVLQGVTNNQFTFVKEGIPDA